MSAVGERNGVKVEALGGCGRGGPHDEKLAVAREATARETAHEATAREAVHEVTAREAVHEVTARGDLARGDRVCEATAHETTHEVTVREATAHFGRAAATTAGGTVGGGPAAVPGRAAAIVRRPAAIRGRLAAVLGSVLLACLVGLSAASADSIFASVGFGRWVHTTDARAGAMGDVSIVGASEFAFSPRNPALVAYLDRAAGYAAVTSEFTRVDGGEGASTRPDATLPLLAAGVPIGAGIVASGSVYQLTDARYDILQTVGGSPGYMLRTKGEGGWTQISATLARSFGDVAFGLQVGLPFTAIDERITRDFADDAAFSDREEKLETDLNDAAFFTLGTHGRLGGLEGGAFFQLPTTATVDARHEAGGVATTSSFELGIPAAFGAGLAYAFPGGLLVAGEYRRQPWDSADVDGRSWRELPRSQRTRGYKDQDAWGAGVEWQPTPRTPRDHPLIWRLGYASEPWIIAGPSYGRVVDRTITAGLGIPFREGNGELDISLRYALRRESTSDLEENIFGIVLGLAFARQPREF